MSDPLAIALVAVGTGFMLLGTIGVLRMPDVYMRLQVASKASSLGAGCLMLGVATHFGDVGIVVRAILVHFWLAYDHPFVDGNGRTARALFYWVMAREGYWLCEYVSISRIL